VWNAEEAIRWYERALAAAGDDDGLVGQAALARGLALEQIGRNEDAHAGYELAVDRARAAGDQMLEARSLASLAHVLWITDRYEDGDRLLPEALEAARRVGATDLEARLLYTAGTIMFGRGAFRASLPFLDGSLSVAEANGDSEGLAMAHHGLCDTYFFLGPFTTALDHALEADLLLRELGQRPMVSHNAYMVGWLRWFLGEWDEADRVVGAALEGSREIGNRRDEAFALSARAEIRLAAGDIAGALADADLSVEAMREVGAPRGEMIAHLIRSSVLAEAWAFDGMASAVGHALRICDELDTSFMRPRVLSNVGWLELRAGNRDRALERFSEADRLGGDVLTNIVHWGSTQILAWEEAGDAERLERVGLRVEDALLTTAVIWGAWGTTARSIAALHRGDHEAAAALAEQALEVSRRSNQRRTSWRAGLVAWRALTALGRFDDADQRRAAARLELEAQVATTPPELLMTFLKRPDVAQLLES
jgi:tetratricopeptide (TPR) repeat protein